MKLYMLRIMLIIVFFISNNLFGQVGIKKLAQSTFNFQLVSTSPRASGMGDAFYAVGNGAESVFYNPAGLALGESDIDVSMSYTQWIADINYLTLAVAYNLGNFGNVAVSLLTVDYGEINATKLLTFVSNEDDPIGYIDMGKMSNIGAYSIGFSYAKSISTQFSIGGSVRLIGQNLGTSTFINGTTTENDKSKLIFDAGVKYLTDFKDFRFGMAVRNFGTSVKREIIDEQLPLTFTIGTAIDLYKFINVQNENQVLTLAIDFLQSNSYTERFNIGLEYIYLKIFSLRAGYQTNRDISSLAAGIGLNTNLLGSAVEINYSYSQMEVFNDINRLSLNFKL
jgi:hypothetical protein